MLTESEKKELEELKAKHCRAGCGPIPAEEIARTQDLLLRSRDWSVGRVHDNPDAFIEQEPFE